MERAYAAEVVLGELLGLGHVLVEEQRADVELTVPGSEAAVRFDDGLFATSEWLEPASLPAGGGHFLYPGDPFGSAFFLLTGYGELVVTERDEHDRFPGREAVVGDLVRRPLVDEYAEVVWQELQRAWPRLERRRKETRTLPSHDVDWPHSPERGLAAKLKRAVGDVARRDPGQAFERARALAGRRDPNDTFDLIMDLSEERGLRSAFYFIAGGTPPRDGDYSIDDPRIRRLLRRIHERGHEIGLHGSYETQNDPTLLAQELGTLQRVCAEERIAQETWGGRQHYLRWEPPLTWRAYDEAGLDYDTSAGYFDRAGFRLGTCSELPVFDVLARRRLRIRERPLVAMEVALLDHSGLSLSSALAELRALKDQCRRHGGEFTLLWHNSRLVSPRERRLYEDALDA
jgi:peptidoglycan/xylan/chitin deacetylase (PgdA/CDA1 family)